MAQLMLINPRKRRASSGKRKARSPAQRAATKRMLAANRSRKTRRHSPALATNPRPRRRLHLKTAARRHHRRLRRNPIGLGGMTGMITDAGIGAVGAIGVDYLYNLLPLPVSMKTGMMGTASKVALALGVGIIGKKVLGNTAGKMAAGSLTVTAYDLIKSFMPPVLPTPAAGLGYWAPGINAGYLPQQGMGEYTQHDFSHSGQAMGEYTY